jgi:hypothetical protein
VNLTLKRAPALIERRAVDSLALGQLEELEIGVGELHGASRLA